MCIRKRFHLEFRLLFVHPRNKEHEGRKCCDNVRRFIGGNVKVFLAHGQTAEDSIHKSIHTYINLFTQNNELYTWNGKCLMNVF